jgi:hypothetical protein
LERLQKKVEKSAKNYDDYAKLKFIMLEKAAQKRSVLKNFMKLESYQTPTDRFWGAQGDQRKEQSQDQDEAKES